MATLYILHSEKINKFYTGSCLNFDERLKEHLSRTYKHSFTTRADDWTLFYKYDNLTHNVARAIENHIKKMKSVVYIQNLKKYPEIIEKLIEKYS